MYLQTEGTWFFFCGILTGEAAEFYSFLYHRLFSLNCCVDLTLTNMEEEMVSFTVWVNSYSMSHFMCLSDVY